MHLGNSRSLLVLLVGGVSSLHEVAPAAGTTVPAVRLFTAPREQPWRRVDGAPESATGGRAAFAGTARPGEYYVFQIGLVSEAATEPLAVRFSELRSEAAAIPATALRCLSLGGNGIDGRPFRKDIRVAAGAVQILWCGIAVPAAAAGGTYRGQVSIAAGASSLGIVDVAVGVAGTPVADHGDSLAKNLSRLRWLDSTVGDAPTLTAPFVGVKVKGRTVKVLGRELGLGKDGLPAQVTSFFNAANTHLLATDRPILSAPFASTASGRCDCRGRGAMRARAGSTSGRRPTGSCPSAPTGVRADCRRATS